MSIAWDVSVLVTGLGAVIGVQQRRICNLRERLGHAREQLADKSQQLEALLLYANVVSGNRRPP